MSVSASLSRRLGTPGSVTIGLASMIGAGIFTAFSPAAAAAGGWMLAGLVIAALVAAANATSTARLAAIYPVSGGSYIYGRERLGQWWGFAAGWSFVVGKTGSCAAMALTFATYLVPTPWQKLAAVAAVLLISAIDLFGITKTTAAAAVLVGIVLAVLVVVAIAGGTALHTGGAMAVGGAPRGLYGVLQSGGILFFAFAGYARVATLGEEVRDPARTIPRAILIALLVTLAIYATLAVITLLVLGSADLAVDATPLRTVVARGLGADWTPVVAIGAAVGALGSLLSLIAGVSRTSLAMARNRDLPRPLARVDARRSVPRIAQLTVTAAIIVVTLVGDLHSTIAFSSFGVLLYYAVANLSAATLGKRVIPILGLIGCVVLAFTLPLPQVAIGASGIAIGLIGRWVAIRVIRARAERR